MPHIISTARPLLWAVTQNNEVLASGVMEAGGLTVTGSDKSLLSDESENAFLGKVAGQAGAYNPLPESGWLEAGAIYGYNGGLVLVRQSHTRTEHAPADIPALLAVYREDAGDVLAWVAGENVLLGTRRTHADGLYEALQPHLTQSDWQPNAPGILGVLWREVDETPAAEWQAGVSYALNALVTHVGRTWKSLMNGNAANQPGVVGTWRDQSSPPMWVQPAGSVGLWQVNDIATHNGQTWRNTSANNAFAPGVFGCVVV